MKKNVRTVLSLFLLSGALVASFATAQATQIEPRWVGLSILTPDLSISSSGRATCKGEAWVKTGYTVDLTMELQQDGTTIKTWTASGSRVVSKEGNYYVASGHDYAVKVTAEVYDSNGSLVESPSSTSPSVSY